MDAGYILYQIRKSFSNPFHCLKRKNITLTKVRKMKMSEEEWIRINSKVINEIGAEKWLEMLLQNLKGNHK